MANKKLKLLYLARYLREETDERHPRTVQDMIAYLERQGISAERKSIYDDLELLEHDGRVYQRDNGAQRHGHIAQRGARPDLIHLQRRPSSPT